MIFFANAKINIGLNILGKRPDGYHDIASVFYPIPFYDIIEFRELRNVNKDFTFKNTGIAIDAKPTDNLCIKAYSLIKEKYNISPLEIHLHKNIPFGAGLGGGSADGAFMINALNNYFKLSISIEDRKKLAAKLGADCVFFIENKVSYVEGIGDIISPVNIDLSNYFIVVIYPGFGVNTAMAYATMNFNNQKTSLKNDILKSTSIWKNTIENNFEKFIFHTNPILGKIKQQLYNEGAIYASMSGSGSSIYGIFENPARIENFPDNYFTWSDSLKFT